MKYAFQFALIISISFIGEILNMLIPLPVPASIYGLVILFFCLELKIIKLHQVKEAGDFLLVTSSSAPALIGLPISQLGSAFFAAS